MHFKGYINYFPFKIHFIDANMFSGYFTILSEELMEVLTHSLITQRPIPNTYGICVSYMLDNSMDHIYRAQAADESWLKLGR